MMTTQPFDPSSEVNEEQRNKALQELEGQDWGEPPYPSHLVTTCHALGRKPLREFTVEDLRIMIGQNIGLPYLVPLAIEQLQRDPLIQGDYFPGDLLAAVVRVKSDFWQARPRVRQAVQAIVDQVTPHAEDLHLLKALRQDLQAFQHPEHTQG